MCVCTSVCEHTHVFSPDELQQKRFREPVPTALIAAVCGSYKYSGSRTKIGIYALLHVQKSLHGREDGQQQAPSRKLVPCPSRTELTVLGASPKGTPSTAPRSPCPSDFVCPAVPVCSARAVPAGGNLSQGANKPSLVKKGPWPADRRGDSPGGGFMVGDSSSLAPCILAHLGLFSRAPSSPV